MKNFRLYQTALLFFKKCKPVPMPRHLREQLDRASASISCNSSEGYGRLAKLDKRRFYRIALGSTRECRTLLILAEREEAELMEMLDFLAGGLYKLSR
jgi:four helix bundle protein